MTEPMALTEGLIKKLRQQYQPHSTIELSFRGKDISIITDKEGNAMQLFIGKRKENGMVKGERYT